MIVEDIRDLKDQIRDLLTVLAEQEGRIQKLERQVDMLKDDLQRTAMQQAYRNM